MPKLFLRSHGFVLALLSMLPTSARAELAQAQPPMATSRTEPALVTGHMIVLASAKTVAEANAVMAKVPQVEFMLLGPGYPQVVDSAMVPGLRPGFQAVAAGVCASKTDAVAAKNVLSMSIGLEATVREVKVSNVDTSCPVLTPQRASALPVRERAALDRRFPDIRWVLRQKALNPHCSHYALGVEVGNTTVYQETYKETGCREDAINTTRFQISIVQIGQVSYARVEQRVDWHDNGTRSENLLGLLCTGVKPVLELGDQYDTVEEISATGDGSGRTGLRLRWKRGECSNCEPSGNVDYVRAAGSCKFEPVKDGR